ncbi:MAG TPA: acyltransferase [Magnetospirillaceae bacterium]|nr:acyltransferase [Magnetospirillaceae bacterium]
METKARLDGLTPLRGLAALWVVLFHADVILVFRQLGGLLDRTASGLISHGYLWVDFFFLLSGFVIAHAYGDRLRAGGGWRDYLAARFARIYPLHLATLVLLIPLRILAAILFPAMQDGSWSSFMAWRAIPSNLLLTHAMNQHVYLSWNIVSWSIGAEWWAYVAALGLLPLIHGRPLWHAGVAALAGAAGLATLVRLVPGHGLDITFDYGFLRCLFEFTLGLALHQAWRAGLLRDQLRGDVIPGILLFAIALLFHRRIDDLAVVPLFMLLILAVSYNEGWVSRLLAGRPLQHLGEISYALYMMHGVWFMIFWFALPELQRRGLWVPQGSVQCWGFAAGFIGLSLLSAELIHSAFEVPARVRLRRLLASAPPAPVVK